jgi:hypothetical protein
MNDVIKYSITNIEICGIMVTNNKHLTGDEIIWNAVASSTDYAHQRLRFSACLL